MIKKLLTLLLIGFSISSTAQNNMKFVIKAFRSKDSSDYYFKKAKDAIVTKQDEAEYFFGKNAYCNDNNKLDSAIYYGEIALKKLTDINKINSVYYVNNNLAKTYSKLGKYDLEKKYLHDNLTLAEKNNSIYWELYSYVAISNTHHDFEDFKNGVSYGKKGLRKALAYKEKGKEHIQSLLNVIAINYDDWNKPDSALYYHKRVFHYVKGKDTLKIGNTYNNIGNTLLKQKKYKEAGKWLNRALKIHEIGDQDLAEDVKAYNKATLYTNLARIAYELDDFEKAEKLFKIAFENASKSQNAEKLRDYYYCSAQFNKKRKNLGQTIADQESYLKLRDSVYQVERSKQVSEMEAKYQSEKKEKELLKSNFAIKEKELQIKKKDTQFQILGLISLALIVIGYLIYRQQKLKNKQQEQEFQLKSAIKEIESQNQLHEQRLSISRDLHDNIGAQLTFVISSVDNLKFGNQITDSKITNQLTKISDFTKTTIVELRDTIWAMNNNEFTFDDLRSRIFNFIEKAKSVKEEISFKFHVDESLNEVKLSSLVGINLYRTIQEAVNNALKYADANEIEVNVIHQNKQVKIEIKDNGKGFDIHTIHLGNGIQNMKKRMQEINGNISFDSKINEGTLITILI